MRTFPALETAGPEGSEEARGSYKASDVLRLAGLTYRQLNDWENRGGVLSSERATVDGWRKFTGDEVLALCVCAHLRRQLSVTLDRLGPIYRWLVGRKPDKVGSLLAEIAEFTLRSMEENEKIVRLPALRGEALTEALKGNLERVHRRGVVRCKLNLLARTPVLLALRLPVGSEKLGEQAVIELIKSKATRPWRSWCRTTRSLCCVARLSRRSRRVAGRTRTDEGLPATHSGAARGT